MDSDKQLEKQIEATLIIKDEGKEELVQSELAQSDPSFLEKILTQRHKQRDGIYYLAVVLAIASFIFLTSLVSVQAVGRIISQDFSVLRGNELEVLSISVFAEILGIIGIIARAIWDDKNYKNVLYRDYRDRNQKDDS
jgi:hypothetical protein